MTSVIDAAVRARACDPAESFVVRAPAGSGKTSLLTERFLRLLTLVEAPEEVVAITFTIKAAAEMRSRILAFLSDAAAGSVGHSHEHSVRELAATVLERDHLLGWRLLEQPTRLRIQTIDALCLGLVRRMTWLSGLGTDMTPIEDAGEHYLGAARAVFELVNEEGGEWHDDIATVLRALDNEVPRFEQMIAKMLSKRDQWLRHIGGLTGDDRERALLESAWQGDIEQTLERFRESFGESMLGVISEMARLKGYLQNGAHGRAAYWRSVVLMFMTKRLEPRKHPVARKTLQEFPAALRDGLAELMGLLEQSARHRELFKTLARLPPERFSDAEWGLLSALVRVLRVAAGLLTVRFSEHTQVDFIELAMAAIESLGAPDNPTDLALSMDYRIHHLLVDEFQDTSSAQIALLKRLTAGWTPGDGRSFFAVGDPMQSIYRFREADVGLYLDVRQRGIGEIRPVALTLSANFRSSHPILNWVNETFALIFNEEEDPAMGAVPYAPSVAQHEGEDTDGVYVHPLIDAAPDTQADEVVKVVLRLLADRSLESIALLVRARTHLPGVLSALARSGVNYRGIDLAPLGDIPIVKDLLALTRALLSPSDTVAWLTVLRSPVCGLTLSDLEILSAEGRDFLPQRVLRDDLRQQLSRDADERLARIREVLANRFQSLQRVGLAAWIESIWNYLGGPATVDETQMVHVASYFALVAEWETRNDGSDIDWLTNALAQKFASTGSETSRLEIMTIHSAKGLEFDAVILPSLERRAAIDERTLLMWDERLDPDGDTELLIAPVPTEADEEEMLYKRLRSIEDTKLLNETTRLLYVAATRAKRQLHLIGNATASGSGGLGKPASGSLLEKLWPVLEAKFLTALKDEPVAEPLQLDLNITQSEHRIRRLPLGAVRNLDVFALPEPHDRALETVVEFDWAGVAAKHIGTVVHQELQLMSAQTISWTPARLHSRRAIWRNTLVALGVPGPLMKGALARVEQALDAVSKDEKAAWILDPSHDDARSEYAITGMLDGRIFNAVVDRTFVCDGVRWIIDYKTGQHEGSDLEAFLDREQERYQPQLNRYAELMSGMESLPIMLGLYFPLHAAWRSWGEPGILRVT